MVRGLQIELLSKIAKIQPHAARLGGITLTNPLKDSDSQFLASLKVTEALKKDI